MLVAAGPGGSAAAAAASAAAGVFMLLLRSISRSSSLVQLGQRGRRSEALSEAATEVSSKMFNISNVAIPSHTITSGLHSPGRGLGYSGYNAEFAILRESQVPRPGLPALRTVSPGLGPESEPGYAARFGRLSEAVCIYGPIIWNLGSLLHSTFFGYIPPWLYSISQLLYSKDAISIFCYYDIATIL